jgi:hypothetical protein
MFTIALPNHKQLIVCSSIAIPAETPTTAIVRLNSGGGQKDVLQEDRWSGVGLRAGDIGKLDGLADRVHTALASHDLVYVCCYTGLCRSVLVAIIYLYRYNHQSLQGATHEVLQMSGEETLHANADSALTAYCALKKITRASLLAV